MSFPTTRHSLIQRLAVADENEDWQQFLADYWGPVCRFAARWGRLQFEDAEDVGSLTFEAVIAGQLLRRWQQQPTARLRTLLCAVVRNIISNRARVQSGREKGLQEHRDHLRHLALSMQGDDPQAIETEDLFYAGWAEDLICKTLRQLHAGLLAAGKANQFRAFYGCHCEGMTAAEVADCLGVPTTSIENYVKRTRQRFADELHQALQLHVSEYCPIEEAGTEVQSEWIRLKEHLDLAGGLDQLLLLTFNSELTVKLGRQSSARIMAVMHDLRTLPRDASAASACDQ